MTSLFDDLELVDDLHVFDDHAIWLAEIAARDEGYRSLFSAAQHCALNKVDPSGIDRVASIPMASRLAVALCDWYDCNLHDLPQYLRGGYATDDGRILMATGYGYDIIDKDMLGNGDGWATRAFAERYDYLLRVPLDVQQLQQLNTYQLPDKVAMTLPFDAIEPRIDTLADGSTYWTGQVSIPEGSQDQYAGNMFLVRHDAVDWLGTPYGTSVTMPAHEGLVMLKSSTGELVATVDPLRLMRSIDPQAHLMHQDVYRAYVVQPNQLTKAGHEYNDQWVDSLSQALAQSPFVSHDATSWQGEQSIDTQTQATLLDDTAVRDMDRAPVSEPATHSSQTPTFQHAQRHKRARSR